MSRGSEKNTMTNAIVRHLVSRLGLRDYAISTWWLSVLKIYCRILLYIRNMSLELENIMNNRQSRTTACVFFRNYLLCKENCVWVSYWKNPKKLDNKYWQSVWNGQLIKKKKRLPRNFELSSESGLSLYTRVSRNFPMQSLKIDVSSRTAPRMFLGFF